MQIQDNLEASFVSEAEMVFTTLSSTGRKVCLQQKLQPPSRQHSHMPAST